MDIFAKLIKIGLSHKEARVYVAALKKGPSSAQILAQTANIKRSTVYEVAKSLQKQGLLRIQLNGKKRLFVASAPAALEVMLEERLLEFQNIASYLEQLPEVTEQYPRTYLCDSIAEIKKAYKRLLEGTQVETVGISSYAVPEVLGEAWMEGYIQKRKGQGVRARTILTDMMGVNQWQERDVADMREVRVLPSGYTTPVNIEIFDQAVFITNLQDPVVGLVIENKEIGMAMRMMFDVMWSAANNPQNP